MTAAQQSIPAGFWENAQGALIPEKLVKDIDKARDSLVREILAQAQQQSDSLRAFKDHNLQEIAAFVSLSADQYGVKMGGTKGNVQLLSFDGRIKVVRQTQETIAFDEQLQAAKELIDACIERWTEDARPEIRALINDAFQVDKAGNISTARVMGLRRLQIDDVEWKRAMDAIADSTRTVASKSLLRIYLRDDASGEYKAISLDVASA